MTNLDLKKTNKSLYNAPTDQPVIVDVPLMTFLMMDGHGDPNTSQRYMDAVQSLYALAYGVRAIRKSAGAVFTVMPLEGVWWFDDRLDAIDGDETYKAHFIWTLMIRLPDEVDATLLDEARAALARKKPDLLLEDVRLERFEEGRSAQILHLGPYSTEQPTIARLHSFIAQSGYQIRGKHHEIYMNDPRKVAPEKIKTIIRYPIT